MILAFAVTAVFFFFFYFQVFCLSLCTPSHDSLKLPHDIHNNVMFVHLFIFNDLMVRQSSLRASSVVMRGHSNVEVNIIVLHICATQLCLHQQQKSYLIMTLYYLCAQTSFVVLRNFHVGFWYHRCINLSKLQISPCFLLILPFLVQGVGCDQGEQILNAQLL